MRVERVANGLHLGHMRFADALVPAFVEKDRGVVAVVDDRIAHQFGALFPAAAIDIVLGVPRGHGLEQAHAIGGFDILLSRSNYTNSVTGR